jgi:hypothetical protein
VTWFIPNYAVGPGNVLMHLTCYNFVNTAAQVAPPILQVPGKNLETFS